MKRKYDLFSAEIGSQAYDTYAQMRREDPVYTFGRVPQSDPILRWLGVDGYRIYFVTCYEDVERVLRDGRTFVNDPKLVSKEVADDFRLQDPFIQAISTTHLLSSAGKDHQRLRSLVNKAFTPKVVKKIEPRIEEIAEQILNEVTPYKRMDLVADYAFPISITVIAELLGVPLDRREDFHRWSKAIFIPISTEIDIKSLIVECDDYIRQLIMQRRRHPADDFLSHLTQVEAEGDRLNLRELMSMVILLLIAGHETTMSLIAGGTLHLLLHPSLWRRLYDDPTLIPQAVEELLRYDSPVTRAVPRWVTRDVELAGQRLHRGDQVIAVIGSANRDENQFLCPMSLDIERKPNPHLAFGKGAHYCLGAPLARREASIALQRLIERFPNLQLEISPGDISWRQTPILHSLERLPVCWD